MKIPTYLKHKPVFVIEDYDEIDGREDSDAMGLSLGLAQWNERGRVEVSAKVWRYTGAKWSRQSEELPLTRVLDLTILLLRAQRFFAEQEERHLGEDGIVERLPMQGEAMVVQLCKGNEELAGDLRLVQQAMGEQGERIGERIRLIKSLIKEIDG